MINEAAASAYPPAPSRHAKPRQGLLTVGTIGHELRRALEFVAEESALKVSGASQQTPAGIVVDLDARGAEHACAEARHEHGGTPLLGLTRRLTDLTFVEGLCWGAHDVVDPGDLAAMVTRLRALRTPQPRSIAPLRGRALVVHPDEACRRLTGSLLRAAGYEVHFVADGAALERELESPALSLVVAGLDAAPDGALGALRRARQRGAMIPWIIAAPPSALALARAEVERLGPVRIHDAFTPSDNILFLANELSNRAQVEQRVSPRLLFGTRVWMRRAGAERDAVGFSYNISQGGLFVRTLATFTAGEELWLEFNPPRTARLVRLTAVVVQHQSFLPMHVALSPPGIGLRITSGLGDDRALFEHSCSRLASHG